MDKLLVYFRWIKCVMAGTPYKVFFCLIVYTGHRVSFFPEDYDSHIKKKKNMMVRHEIMHNTVLIQGACGYYSIVCITSPSITISLFVQIWCLSDCLCFFFLTEYITDRDRFTT